MEHAMGLYEKPFNSIKMERKQLKLFLMMPKEEN